MNPFLRFFFLVFLNFYLLNFLWEHFLSQKNKNEIMGIRKFGNNEENQILFLFDLRKIMSFLGLYICSSVISTFIPPQKRIMPTQG